mgnify:CR=1 FL=1
MTKLNEKAIEHLLKDKILSKIIKSNTLPERNTKDDVYISLLGSIVSQQLSTKAAATIYDRFIHLFEDKVPTPENLIKISVEKLRAVGLSNQKASYVKNIAEHFIQNPRDKKYWNKRSDDEIIQELTSIKGVGVWTVQMVLMFTLKREDIFPINDLIIRNSVIKYYKITDQGKEQLKVIEKIVAKWSPYKSIACYYLWAAKDGLK